MQAALAEAAFTVSDRLFDRLADEGVRHGACSHCARLRRLKAGRVERHYLVKSRRGGGEGNRKLCPGSGQLPRSRPGVER